MTQDNKQFYVIGHPIKHSKSPIIHTHWFEQYGIDAGYETFEIEPNNFDKDINHLKQNADGWNITLPYKQEMIPTLDKISKTAKEIGAVNTVYKKDDQLCGDNTDIVGIKKSLINHSDVKQWSDKKALIIGAGGAARSACLALKQMGVSSIYITNRTIEKAQNLKEEFDLDAVVNWDEVNDNLSKFDVICQMSSVGLKNETRLPFDFRALKETCICFDAVYNPLETEFLKHANAKGCVTIDGLWMLLYQAAGAFELWFGFEPKIDTLLREKLSKDLL